MKKNLAHEYILIKIATLGGLGRFLIAPGTLASLLATIIGYIILLKTSKIILLFLIIVIFCIGILAAKKHYKRYKKHDSNEIVIDEVVGQWVTIIFINENLLHLLLAFVLFRFFDIIKPWPISLADKNIKSSFGVMFDDILAGVFAGILISFLIYYKII